jgi:uncharacterized protein (UPF0333 family)
MDQRAQISIEYILLIAIILLVVLIFASIAFNENENNDVASAVQLGANNATANMVFTNTSQAPVRVTSVNMTNSSSTQYNIVIHFSGHVSNPTLVFNSIINSLNTAGFNNTSQNSTAVVVTTQKLSYIITLG